MLEQKLHERSCFITLTYNKEHVPSDGSLRYRDCQLFLKRLRSRIYPVKVRYFLVGEYGEKGRPHYHALLFGICDRDLVAAAWVDDNNESLGFVHVGFLSEHSAAYCVQYVCKAWTKEVPELRGRVPEFARMSLRPEGLGAGAVEFIGEAMVSRAGAEFIAVNGDVSGVFRMGGKLWPLGRYLKQKLRDSVGVVRREAIIASMTPMEKVVIRARDEHLRDVSRARADYFRRERMRGKL